MWHCASDIDPRARGFTVDKSQGTTWIMMGSFPIPASYQYWNVFQTMGLFEVKLKMSASKMTNVRISNENLGFVFLTVLLVGWITIWNIRSRGEQQQPWGRNDLQDRFFFLAVSTPTLGLCLPKYGLASWICHAHLVYLIARIELLIWLRVRSRRHTRPYLGAPVCPTGLRNETPLMMAMTHVNGRSISIICYTAFLTLIQFFYTNALESSLTVNAGIHYQIPEFVRCVKMVKRPKRNCARRNNPLGLPLWIQFFFFLFLFNIRWSHLKGIYKVGHSALLLQSLFQSTSGWFRRE